MRVLTLVKHYLPGYKSGGPIRSLANIVEHLGGEFDFTIVTYDRDSGDELPYPHLSGSAIHRVGKAEVIYLSAAKRHFLHLATVIKASRPDVLYVNSFFQSQWGVAPIALRYLGLLPDVPLILAPRGEFSTGALGLKSVKKRAYLWVAKALGAHRDITWQASSSFEAAEIRRHIATTTAVPPEPPLHDAVFVVPDLLPPAPAPRRRDGHTKTPGRLRVVFLSRLAPKKNLLGALHMLARVRGEVEFTIYGPVEDRRYWNACQEGIGALPPNVRVRYAGAVDHTQVADVMVQHDLFLFPTLGENYGHVIVEALMAGCPVLISDRTPWRNLTAAGVGWDLPLEQPQRFGEVLDACIAMDGLTFSAWSARAVAFAVQHANDPRTVEANRALFRNAIHTPATQGAADAALCSHHDAGLP